MRYIFLWVFLLIFQGLAAQADTLMLLNGKRFAGSAVDTSGVRIKFNVWRGGKKPKMKSFFRDQVFSLTDSTGGEHVFYFPDFYYADALTVENMRLEIYGRIDARKGYRTKWVIPVGIAGGFAAGYFMKGSIWSVFAPVIYTGLVQIPIVKIQHKSISNPDFIGNDFYAGGYDRSARMKRTIHAVISSFVGLAAGILVYEVTK